MKLVVGIDVGIKNLAFCAVRAGDGGRTQIEEWANEQLTDGTYLPLKNVEYVRAFVQRHEALLNEADVVVVERQMRVNMRIIEAVLHALYFKKCIVVQARTVKAHYGLCMRNYRLNKQAAVEYVAKLLEQEGDTWRHYFEVVRKKDDLADAYLMARYFSSEQHCGTAARRCPPQTCSTTRTTGSMASTTPSTMASTTSHTLTSAQGPIPSTHSESST